MWARNGGVQSGFMSLVRMLLLAGVGLSLFSIAAFVLIQVVPRPHSAGDYLIIGCLSMLVALFAVFLILITTLQKGSETFFKRRQK